MLDIIIYCVASMMILFAIDWYAIKKIGGKNRAGYKILKVPKAMAIWVIAGFTLIIGFLCMFTDLTISRYVLTYFGMPYFLALLYYMITVFRRVKAETKGRRL